MPDPSVHRYQFDVPGKLSDFDPKSFVDGALEWADGVVGKRKVALSASGGVDSTSVAFLMNKAIGDRLYLFFIHDGLRRVIGGREEADVSAEMFSDFRNFEVLHTSKATLPWFEGIEDGTLKRDIFRGLYTIASNRYIAEIHADMIADGTIAPDIVMTDQKRQTQHNVDLPYGLPKIEILASLYKPHVRKVAMHLGLPKEFAMRIPCPGPAQLLRVGGRFSQYKLEVAKDATDVVEQAVESYCKRQWGEPFRYDEGTGVRTPFQYFGTCLDPGMEMDAELTDVVKKVTGESCECYKMGTNSMWIDMSVSQQERKLYAPILWIVGPRYNGDELLKLYDKIREKAPEGVNVPRVLYEVFDSSQTGHPVGIKAVKSADVREAEPLEIDYDSLSDIGEQICRRTGASKVAYDISRRPPATIEMF